MKDYVLGLNGKDFDECDLSIIVLSYFEEKTITDCLNSIKYQIENYGKKLGIQLIIADDKSGDATPAIIKKWVEVNRELFIQVIILHRDDNLGTASNWADAIRHVKGQHLLKIDGDDVFAKNNVINIAMSCLPRELIISVPLLWNGESVVADYTMYKMLYLSMLYSRQYLMKASMFKSVFDEGMIYGTELISDDRVLDYIERFDLLEDQSSWLKMLEIFPDINIRFANVPTIAYRNQYRDRRVTSVGSKTNERLCADLIKLLEDSATKHSNFYTRMECYLEKKRIIAPSRYKLFWRFFNLDEYYSRCILFLHIREVKKKYNEYCRTVIDYSNFEP